MANDGGIHFPPGRRREKPAFEPPPWEAEQFEKLAQRKQDSAQEEAVAEGPGPSGSGAGERNELPPEARGERPIEIARPLDEKQVEVLMLGLRAEEPRTAMAYWRITAAVGVLCVLIGLSLLTWAVAGFFALSGGGPGATLLVSILVAFGAGFLGGGVWLIFKSLRQQGVL